MRSDPILWYFADRMCSWCWGFAPGISQVREGYRDRPRISLVLGGLWPGTTAPLTPRGREEILHHWHQVHEHTGQDLKFDNAMPAGFVYDTEPRSRAVACVADLDPASIFPVLTSAQNAFCAVGLDITRTSVLARIAVELGADESEFLAAFESDTAHHRVREHFRLARERGVRGFPTLMLQQAGSSTLSPTAGNPSMRC